MANGPRWQLRRPAVEVARIPALTPGTYQVSCYAGAPWGLGSSEAPPTDDQLIAWACVVGDDLTNLAELRIVVQGYLRRTTLPIRDQPRRVVDSVTTDWLASAVVPAPLGSLSLLAEAVVGAGGLPMAGEVQLLVGPVARAVSLPEQWAEEGEGPCP